MSCSRRNLSPSNKLGRHFFSFQPAFRERKNPATSLYHQWVALHRDIYLVAYEAVTKSISEVFWRMTSVLNQLMRLQLLPLLLLLLLLPCATTRGSFIDRLMWVDGTDTWGRVRRFKNDTSRWFSVIGCLRDRVNIELAQADLLEPCPWLKCRPRLRLLAHSWSRAI